MAHLKIKVVPGSSVDRIMGMMGDHLKVKVRAPAESGRANKALVTLIARWLGVEAGRVVIASGHQAPRKVVSLDGVDEAVIRERIESL